MAQKKKSKGTTEKSRRKLENGGNGAKSNRYEPEIAQRKSEGNRREAESNLINMSDRPVKSRIIAHRMRIAAVILGILLILAATGAFVYWRYQNQFYTGYDVVGTVERININSAKVLSYNNYFLTYSKDGIHCTDSKGNDIWSTPYEMQDPMVEMSGNYVAVADYNGRTVYVFDPSGEIGKIQINNPIHNLKISSTGIVAIVVDGGDITPIYLYDYTGKEIAAFRTTMAKSGYPVSVGLSENSKLVGVSYLYLDKGVLTTKVAFYNFGDVGQNATDNLVSGYDYQNEIVPVLEFLDDSTAFAVANDKLMFYQGKERPVNKENILLHEKIKSVYFGSGYVGLVYLDSAGEARYCMDVYNNSGKKMNTIKFDMEYSDIFFDGDNVVIYNASDAEIYNMQGRKKYEGSFEEAVLLMLPTTNPIKYVLVTPDEIQTITLR